MWFLGFLVAFFIAAYLVREYAESKTHVGVQLIVGFSWALGFSYFLVLPFDISGAFCRACVQLNGGGVIVASPDSGADGAGAAEGMPAPPPPPPPEFGECDCFPMPGLEMLEEIVPLCYGMTMLNGYLMNDLLRSYLDSGEFTRRGRLRDALKEAAIFYVPALIIGLTFVVYMVVNNGLDFQGIRALGRGFVNAIGLFILVAFLGYGFVEVPRYLLNKGNVDGQLRYLKFRVAVQSENLQNARRKLEETLELVKQTDLQLRSTAFSNLHEHMAVILRRCPRSARSGGVGGASSAHGTAPMRPAAHHEGGEVTSAPPTPPDAEMGAAPPPSMRLGGSNGDGGAAGGAAVDEKLLPTTRRGLVALHLRLRHALANEKRQRSMYEEFVRQALTQQALFEPHASAVSPRGGGCGGMHRGGGMSSGAGGSGSITSSTAARARPASGPTLVLGGGHGGLGGDGSGSLAVERAGRWHGQLKPMLYRVMAVLCGILSVVIIWCEGTILFDDAPFNLNLSPLSYFFRAVGRGGGGVFSIVLLYIPLLYCAVCTYFAMFQMKLCDSIALHPHKHSDGSSLLFNATYACRLGPPLCFNFLKLLHETDPRGLFVGKGKTHATAVSTYFTLTSFGHMDQIPFFSGDYFNNYAPLLIVVIAGCTLLNLGSGLLQCCAKCCPCVAGPTFSFDDDFSDARIDHGAQILLHEKQALAEGIPLGANLQLLSGATSDTEDGTRMRSAIARATPARSASRFRQLNDDHL